MRSKREFAKFMYVWWLYTALKSNLFQWFTPITQQTYQLGHFGFILKIQSFFGQQIKENRIWHFIEIGVNGFGKIGYEPHSYNNVNSKAMCVNVFNCYFYQSCQPINLFMVPALWKLLKTLFKTVIQYEFGPKRNILT